MVMDFSFLTKALSDPNVLQGMGNAGAALSSGASFGEAFNPAEMIRNIQGQKATQDILRMLAGGGVTPQVPGAGGGNGVTPAETPAIPTPTPKGQAGPDSVITKKTADGETVTINTPSEANLNSFGTNTPPEAKPASGYATSPSMSTAKGENLSPFWQALFS